jgi:hypothetical protein
MGDFAQILAQKELVNLLKLTIHRAAAKCKEGLRMVGLEDL